MARCSGGGTYCRNTERDKCDVNICISVLFLPSLRYDSQQKSNNSVVHAPAFAKARVLIFEAVQALGEEHDNHKEQEEDEAGHSNHHAQHLELCDGPFTAQAFIPDVVLYVTPGHKGMGGRTNVIHS